MLFFVSVNFIVNHENNTLHLNKLPHGTLVFHDETYVTCLTLVNIELNVSIQRKKVLKDCKENNLQIITFVIRFNNEQYLVS